MLPFKFAGKIISGEKKGRKIGFPTANLDNIPDKNNLETGVYIGTCNLYFEDRVKNHDLKCLAYFGPRYIFGQEKNSFEIYIYNFNQNIYDLTLEVNLLKLLRKPIKFSNLKELKNQLEIDKKQGLMMLQS